MQEFAQASRAEGVEAGIKIGMARASRSNGHIVLPEPSEMAEYCHARLGRLKDDKQREFIADMFVITQRRKTCRWGGWGISRVSTSRLAGGFDEHDTTAILVRSVASREHRSAGGARWSIRRSIRFTCAARIVWTGRASVRCGCFASNEAPLRGLVEREHEC